MRNVAITLKSSTNEERSYHRHSLRQMSNVAITLKYVTNEERSYLPPVFDK